MLELLEESNQLVSGQTAEIEGRLRVSVTGMFAEQHIVPALVEFASDHPQLTLEISFDTHNVNFVDENVDFAVRYGAIADSALIARKLANHQRIAVASPAYFERHGAPRTPQDLRRHNCLICGEYQRWPFETPQGNQEVRVTGKWRSNNEATIVEACRRGVGIAYLQRENFGSSLRDGELVPTLEPYWTSEMTSWIVYPNRKYLPARARRAVDFLLERFRDWRRASVDTPEPVRKALKEPA